MSPSYRIMLGEGGLFWKSPIGCCCEVAPSPSPSPQKKSKIITPHIRETITKTQAPIDTR